MTVNLILFHNRGWSSSPARNCGHCGYLGPRPSTPGQPARPKSLKRKRPRHQSTQKPGLTLRWGTPRGLGPDISRPRNAWPTLRPGALGSHSPDALFSSSAYFFDRKLSQAKLQTGSTLYKRKFTHELTPSPPTK